ncbi:Crp/Fnr family transcriptional regulator [Alkalicoccus urumqiensis]|nr:Crp/Fnr family transcriptional regulator [Alkalicoccus urumqiensis]
MYEELIDTPFFQGSLPEKERDRLEGLARKRTYLKGQALYFEGDPGDRMYIVQQGVLKIFREHHGQQIVLGHQFPGQAIGELEMFHYEKRRTAGVAVLEEAVLWSIDRPVMQRLASLYPDLLYKTIYILSERLTQADRKLEYLAFLDVKVRAANLLLDLAANKGRAVKKGVQIDWKITQQHAADMIGASRESMARCLQDMQKEAMIQLQGRTILITDMPALEQMTAAASTLPRDWHLTDAYSNGNKR